MHTYWLSRNIEKGKQLNFGYIKPGHGKKGKQISDDDLREMYPRYKKGTNILLWIKHSVITRQGNVRGHQLEQKSLNAFINLSLRVLHLGVVKLVDRVMINILKK